MNWPSWLVWGFAGTVVLTTIMAGSQGLRLTRMNIPFMLGTMFTADRDRAKIYGVALHLVNGWMFSLIYVFAFEVTRLYTWWFGAAIAGMPVLPGLHPRMASERRGPTVVEQLEPPGFMAMNYGIRTPISVLVAHVVFGAILGGFYVARG
jgi:hypothetical protein